MLTSRHFQMAWLIALTAIPVSWNCPLDADEPNLKKRAALTAEAAGADFAVQGEYTGEITTDDGELPLGVQVIALGDGKFHAVGYPFGLPGAGWNGIDKHEADGETVEGVTRLTGENGMAVIQDGFLTVLDSDENPIGTLVRTRRVSKTLGEKPPAGAVVLFDGSTADTFDGGRMTDDGLLQEGCTSHEKFQSCRLHLEFQLSFMPHARGQGRSNSGCYMQGRYEIQILDSFGLTGEQNECGGLYSIAKPKVNMCFPPLNWQTYDIDFTAAKFNESGDETAPARITVRQNGVVIHDNVELPKSTTASPLKPGAEAGPIFLQNHGNPLRFRNIWVVPQDA